MCRYLVALCSLLFLASGCHRAHLPVLPASHGYLALAVERQLAPDARAQEDLSPADSERLEVSPSEAPTVLAEALRVLKGRPTEAEVQQARQDVSAACAARLQDACEFLRRETVAPTFVHSPEYLVRGQAPRLFTLIVHQCRITTEGTVRDCELVEGSPPELAQARLLALHETRMTPLRFAGHPLEQRTTFVAHYQPGDARLSHEQQLDWARQRVRKFPGSVMAWKNLAQVLSSKVPVAPAYAEAVRELHVRAPRYWWAAGEQARLHAEAGRYAQALPLAEQARDGAPHNPYVRELLAKVLAGLGRCEEAVAEQRRAVEALPSEWLDAERERFTRMLSEYPRQCTQGAAGVTQPQS